MGAVYIPKMQANLGNESGKPKTVLWREHGVGTRQDIIWTGKNMGAQKICSENGTSTGVGIGVCSLTMKL